MRGAGSCVRGQGGLWDDSDSLRSCAGGGAERRAESQVPNRHTPAVGSSSGSI